MWGAASTAGEVVMEMGAEAAAREEGAWLSCCQGLLGAF